VVSWSFVRNPEASDDPPSRVVFEIEELGDTSRLTLTHEGFDEETWTYRSVGEGWPKILSGMKSMLETGEPLSVARD
jgi:hypothetical protein